MEKFFIEEPTIDRKQEALDYVIENVKYNSSFNGMGGIEKCLEGMSYEKWLSELKRKSKKEYSSKYSCPSKTFFLVRSDDDRIVGMINVRYNILSEQLNSWASHIGYGIRPTERQKGYAKIALYLALLEEQKIGEERVLLICDVDNMASNKTIKALGGILEKTELYEYDNLMTNYYWINVKSSIDKYYGQFGKYIEK